MNLSLRFSSLLGVCFLVFAAIVLAYLAGVMRGRASLAERPSSPKAAVSAPTAEKNVPRPERDKILAPEDLRYSAALKERQPQQNKLLEPVKPPSETSSAALNATIAREASPSPQGNLYDFVFQVGTFKDENSADTLRQRLEGRGLRTKMQRKGKAVLVLVNLRGTEQRAAEIPSIMEELRLGKPVLLSKKTAGS